MMIFHLIIIARKSSYNEVFCIHRHLLSLLVLPPSPHPFLTPSLLQVLLAGVLRCVKNLLLPPLYLSQLAWCTRVH